MIVDRPAGSYHPRNHGIDGVVIAVYHRINDVEDKWIVAEEGTDFSDEEIMKKSFR